MCIVRIVDVSIRMSTAGMSLLDGRGAEQSPGSVTINIEHMYGCVVEIRG